MKKAIIAAIAIVVIGGLAYAGFWAVKNRAKLATKEDLEMKTEELQQDVKNLEAKIDEMKKEQATASTAEAANVPNQPSSGENMQTQTTTSEEIDTSAEDESIEELEAEIEEMNELSEETIVLLEDIEAEVEELDEAASSLAASSAQMADDVSTLVAMAVEAQTAANQALAQAQTVASSYSQALKASQEMVAARKELYQANIGANQDKITAASAKFSQSLENNAGKTNPQFAKLYFSKLPKYLGNIEGISGVLAGLNIQGMKFDFSKMNISLPKIPSGQINLPSLEDIGIPGRR